MSATSSASSPAGGGLVVAGLTKRFGSLEVLRGVDLEVREGTTTAILGPSGCGKTTMLRLVAGFDRPDAGSITLAGRTLHDGRTSLPPEDRHVGYVAQEGALFPHLSVEANVLFGVRRSRRRAGMAEELLELVGLEPGHARRLPHQLSGGQQQRVALARALAPDPALVLLDEPFSSLDASLRASTRQAVADVLAARGATAVLVTHDQDEALSMADQVAVVRHGVLAQVADPVTLYRTPADVETAAFVGAGNFLPATVEGGQARCELGGFPAPGRSDGPALVLVRPEQVLVHGSGRGEEGPAATVVGSTFHGGEVVLRLELASGTALVAHVPGWARPEVGDVVGLGVAGPAHVLPG